MNETDIAEKLRRFDEIEKRLKVVEDIEDIKQLHYRYVNCIMFAKWDEIMECFADESEADLADGLKKGKAEIEKDFRERIAQIHIGREGDLVVHPIISVDGNTATGNWIIYLMYSQPRTWQSLFWVQGIYDAKYVKENGQWKFSFLKWTRRLAPPGSSTGPRDE